MLIENIKTEIKCKKNSLFFAEFATGKPIMRAKENKKKGS